MSKIAKTAVIEDGAIIGENVEIGEFCFISKNTQIDDNTIIKNSVTIEGRTKIGKNCKIYQNAVLGGEPQSIKYKGEDVGLIIGDNNIIREFVQITAGTAEFNVDTKIGDNNFIMAYSHIAHDCIVGNGCVFANGATLAGHVEIGDYVTIGGLTPIHQFVKIGSYTMIGGASAVSQDIPPYCLAEGNRAKIRSLNRIGLRKRMDSDAIDKLHSAYKESFSGKAPYKEIAKEILQRDELTQEVKYFCSFLIESKRGIPFLRNIND